MSHSKGRQKEKGKGKLRYMVCMYFGLPIYMDIILSIQHFGIDSLGTVI